MEARKFEQENERDLQWLQIAHDLKSPLTALEIIAARLQTLPPEERRLLSQAVGRIQEIVVHVLRPDPRGSVPAFQESWAPEDLQPLLQEKQLEFPNVRFRLEIAANGPVCQKIPRDRMTRVLSNLLNNAAEANHGTGVVFVRVQADKGYAIEIEDQGQGIPAEIRAHLGQPGVSGKPSASTRRGFGLFSAFQFIEQMGGQMAIRDCSPESGTVVRLDLSNATEKLAGAAP